MKTRYTFVQLILGVIGFGVIGLIVITATSDRAISQTTWGWSNPRPQGNSLQGVYIRKDSLGIAMGDFGTTIRRIAGQFEPAAYSGTKTLRAMANTGDTLWMVGDSGTLLRSSTSGTSWVNQLTGYAKINFRAVSTPTIQYVFIVGDSGYVVRTYNGGGSYGRQTAASTKRLNGVGFNGSTGYAVGDSGTLLKAFAYGSVGWSSLATGVHHNLYATANDTNDQWIVGDQGYVLHRDMHGDSTLSDSVFGSALSFNSLIFSTPYIVAVGNAGVVLRSADNGANWTRPSSGVTENLNAVAMAQDSLGLGHLWAVGQNGVFITSSDFGATWNRRDSGSRAVVYAITGSPSGALYATSNQGSLYHSENNGASWRRDSINGAFNQLYDISFTPKGFGLIATNGTSLLQTIDSGRTWQAKAVSTTQILGVTTTADSIGIAVGANGTMYRTINRGTTWTSITTGTSAILYDVDAYGPNLIAVGGGGNSLYSNNYGATWTLKAMGTTGQFNRIRMATARMAIAVGILGAMRKTTDAGATWTALSSGTTATLRDISWHDDVNGLVVGDVGLILKTHDAGATWASDVTRTAQDLYGAYVTSGTNAFVGGNLGTILSTTNSALPVNLLEMHASRRDASHVDLGWSVAAQVDNAGFAIERLGMSGSWNALAFIPGDASLNSAKSFAIADNNASANVETYRVTQVDLNGERNILGTITAAAWHSAIASASMALWPNPMVSAGNISVTIPTDQFARLRIVNVLGQEMMQVSEGALARGSHAFSIDCTKLPVGQYRAILETGGELITTPITVIR
jgi:photosystem II stability/assembly factor-like uncharacterized protein